jgi:hypothetical protein
MGGVSVLLHPQRRAAVGLLIASVSIGAIFLFQREIARNISTSTHPDFSLCGEHRRVPGDQPY